jgi:hypothetical protein
MSLARTALRLATMEALAPTVCLNGAAPWPTLAGKHVFDSRLDPLEDLNPHESLPVVCVYTDHEEDYAGQKKGGPPFRQVVDLVFEISVVARVPSDADPQVFELAYPETDAEMEASLDLLEAQIKFVLLYHPGGKIWQDVTGRKVTDPRSVPHRSSEEGVRLARRTVTWKVEIPEDCFDPAPIVNPTGLDRLPQKLRGVIKALAATSYGAKIGQGLALGAPVMPLAQPLGKILSGLDLGHTGTPQVNLEVDL